MFIKNLIMLIFFSTVLVPTYSVNITVEDFRNILGPDDFERLDELHQPSELTEKNGEQPVVIPNPKEGRVTLGMSQSYKKSPAEKWATQLKVFTQNDAMLICIFGKQGIHHAYSIGHHEAAIADKTLSSLGMARRIYGDFQRRPLSCESLRNISHGIILTNKFLHEAEKVKQIMSTETDATLLQIVTSKEGEICLSKSIDRTQYPADRVKTLICCPNKTSLEHYSIDTDKRTGTATCTNYMLSCHGMDHGPFYDRCNTLYFEEDGTPFCFGGNHPPPYACGKSNEKFTF